MQSWPTFVQVFEPFVLTASTSFKVHYRSIGHVYRLTILQSALRGLPETDLELFECTP